MEKNIDFVLPPEIWVHILTYADLDGIFKLRPVCKMFYAELKNRNPLESIKDLRLQQDEIVTYRNRRITYLTDAQIVDYFLHGEKQMPLSKESDGQRQFRFKAILVGPMRTGKTTLWSSYSFQKGRFAEYYETGATGIDFIIRTTNHLGVQSKLQLWDTAGIERFRSFPSSSYCRGALGAVLCFSITNRASFVELVNEMIARTVKLCEPNVICYLVGTKSDLEPAREVSRIEAETVAWVLNMKYFEVSAAQFKNVNEVFDSLRIDMLHAVKVNEATLKTLVAHSKGDRRCNMM